MWLASVQRDFPIATVSFEDGPRQVTACARNEFLQEEREGAFYGPQREKRSMDPASFPKHFSRKMKCSWMRLCLYISCTLELRLIVNHSLLSSPKDRGTSGGQCHSKGGLKNLQ